MYKISEKATLLFSYVNHVVTYLPHLEDGRDDPAVEILETESGRDGGSTGRVFMSERKASNLKHRTQVCMHLSWPVCHNRPAIRAYSAELA